MNWPPWPFTEYRTLSRYVNPEAGVLLPKIPHINDLRYQSNAQHATIQQLYEALYRLDLDYTIPPFNPQGSTQIIRTPQAIIRKEQWGTCLDLALLFCGVCLHHDLLPLLILCKKHVLVAVSLKFYRQDLYRESEDEFNFFEQGLLPDQHIDKLREWIDRGRYLALECTGFVASASLDSHAPEGRGRIERRMGFERAFAVGREQLDYDDRPFLYALDVDYLHRNGFPPYPIALDDIEPSIIEERLDQLLAIIDEFDRLSEDLLHRQDRREAEFYRGSEPVWPDIVAEKDIQRDLLDRILKITSAYQDQPAFLLISGEPGSGKSTLLKRVGVELYRRSKEVLEHRHGHNTLSFEVVNHIYETLRRPFYILVDDIFRKQNIDGFLKDLAESDAPIFVIGTSRSNEREETRANLLRFTDADEYDLSALRAQEINALCDKLAERGLLKVTDPEVLAPIKKAMERESQMLVIMARLVGGDDFQTIVQKEQTALEQSSAALSSAYAYICMLYQVGVAMPVSLLRRLVGVQDIYGQVVNRSEARGIIVLDPGNRRLVRARHEFVAEMVVKLSRPYPEQVEDTFVEILNMVRPHEADERATVLALLQGMLIHKLQTLVQAIIGRIEPAYLESFLAAAGEQELITGWAYTFWRLGEAAWQESCYRVGLERFAESSLVHLRYAQFLATQGRPDEAEIQFVLANQLESDETRAANSYAAFLIDRKQFDRAAEILGEALVLSPSDNYLALTYARLLSEQGQEESAEQYYKAAIESRPEDRYARIMYARFLWRNARAPEALDQIEELLEFHPSANDILGLFSTFCRKVNQTERATRRIRRALADNPRNVSIWQLMVSFLRDAGHITSALEQAYAAVLIHPKNAMTRRLYADVLVKAGQTKEAVAQLAEYFKLAEGTTDEHLLLLALLTKLEPIEEHSQLQHQTIKKVFQLFRRSLRSDMEPFRMPPLLPVDENLLRAELAASTDFVPLLFYFRYLLINNRGSEADLLLQQLLLQQSHDEQDEQLRLRAAAHLLRELSRTAESMNLLREAIQRWPTASWPHIDLISLLKVPGMEEELEQEITYVSEHFPAYLPARIANVNTLLESGDSLSAEDELRNLLPIAPRNPSIRNTYVRLLLKEERFAEAETQLREIVGLNPEDVGARRVLINLLRLRGAPEAQHHTEFLTRIGVPLPTSEKGTQRLPGLLGRHAYQEVDKDMLRTALDKTPTATKVLAHYVDVLMRDGHQDQASQEIEKALRINTPPRASLRRLYAEFLDRTDQTADAETQYLLGLEEHPEKPGNYVSYAMFLDRYGRTEEARDWIARGRGVGHLLLHAKQLTALAGLAHKQGDLQQAKQYYRLSLLADDQDPISYLTYAVFLEEIGEPDQAERSFKAAIDLNPNFIAARQAYAVFLGQQGRNQEAYRQFEELVATDNVPVLSAYASFLVDRRPMRDWARRAEELFKRALALDPHHIQSLVSYALLLKRQKRYREADDQFQAALAAHSEEYALRQAYAVFLKERRNYNKARQQLEQAFDPRIDRYKSRLHNAMVHNAYADLLSTIGAETKEVINHYEQALDIEPIDPKVRFHLVLTHNAFAEYLCRSGRFEDAQRHFEQALQFEHDNSYIRNAYARCLEWQRCDEDALTQYLAVLGPWPHQMHALGGAGKVLHRLNRSSEAWQYFERALEVEEDNVHILFPYAKALLDTLRKQSMSGPMESALLQRVRELIDRLKQLQPGRESVIALDERLQALVERDL